MAGLRDLTVLLTATGSPGTAALVRALRENGERRIRLVGTDMAERAVGRHLCDSFHLVPGGEDPAYADSVRELCLREGVDAVLPQSSFDLLGLAEAKDRFDGVVVLTAGAEAVRRSNDKAASALMLERIGVPTPAWRRVRGAAALAGAATELGYPERDVCMKPVFGSGSRGFRVLSATVDRRDQLLNAKPGALGMRLEEVTELLERGDDLGPELLVMELATGGERTIDGFAARGRVVLGHAKTREAMRCGLAMYFRTLDDPALMEIADRVCAELALDHFFNIQLVGDHVIEVNPRISTVVYQEDLNLPYLGLKHALGESTAEDLAGLTTRVRPTRRSLRYFDQVDWDDDPAAAE
jgi:carbamoyl-phosphate synthase large subunit